MKITTKKPTSSTKKKDKKLVNDDTVTDSLQNISLNSDNEEQQQQPQIIHAAEKGKSKKKEKLKSRKKMQKNKLRSDEEDDSRNSEDESEPEHKGGSSAEDDKLSEGGDLGRVVDTSGGGDDDDDDDDNDSLHSAEESDSSEDEVGPRNTVGDVPLEFYKEEDHIGYDLSGKKLKKRERMGKLEKYLANADDKKAWRKLVDDYNDEEVEMTKDEIRLIKRILQGKTPFVDADPHPDYVDWFKWEGKHPLINVPPSKRQFTPSKWEHQTIKRLVRAIREGRIKSDVPKEEPQLYDLWSDNSASFEKTRGLSFIPPPKQKLPGHEESYNPSLEYIPTQEEIDSYELMHDEDRPKLIPKKYESLRNVPAYPETLTECQDRCLDLYMCPRIRKKRLNIDPESLKKKDRPKAKDFKPYPSVCYIEYKGHNGAVVSISPDASGQWIASGSSDGSVRVWEVATGKCIRVWEFDHPIHHVAWNPSPQLPVLAVTVGPDVFIFDTLLGSDEEKQHIKTLLQFENLDAPDKSGNTAIVSWVRDDKHGGVRVNHFKTVSSVEWHRRGDYFSTVMPAGESRGVVLHQLSKKLSKPIEYKLHGLPVCTAFHPQRSYFFVATKKNVRVYDLLKGTFVKKLDSKLREISCMVVHPGGDNVLVGSREGKWSWFDMDLSTEPYKTSKSHSKDITNVAFHRSYPLFASCSVDSQAYVYHGMVYSDLNQDPFLFPLVKFLGHSSSKEKGVLDCKFHPRQPWLFTAGADSVIKLYCH